MRTPAINKTPEHWKLTTLGDICARAGGSIQTGPFGSQLHASDYVPVGVPSIMPVNIGDNRLVEEGIARITEADAERLSKHRVQSGDIIYSRRGDVERRALVHDREEGWLCGTGCLKIRFGSGVVDPQYASYYLGHPAVRQWIVRHAVGATMPNLNTAIMAAVPFALPPLAEQRGIAHILGTLDDKIELNRRMNATLESMARSIFKSWFVDFDPVRAKQAGRKPQGLDPATAALFPDSFERCGKELMPVGWTVMCVADIGKVVCGKTPSTKVAEYFGNDVPFITIPDMHGNIFATATKRMLSYAGAQSQQQKTLPAGAISVSCIATPGLTVITSEESQTNQQINSVVPQGVDVTYFWFWTLRGLGDDILAGGSGGSVLTNLSTGRFSKLRVLAPPSPLRSAYHEAVRDIFGRILENEHESASLIATRDTLLPKLLSGEVRVDTAEAAIKRGR